MTWIAVAFAVGALVGSMFPAFRWRPDVLAKVFTKEKRESDPWDSRFW
jgi:hypothetical protein